MPTHALRALVLAGVLAAAAASAHATDTYNQTILNDRPILFLGMDTPASGTQADLSGNGHNGAYRGGTPPTAKLPNGDAAADFNGSGEYVTVNNVANLSVPATGVLTIESWMRPDTLTFPHTEAEGYVYWLGKCSYSTGCEYANRMYSLNNTAGRANRISDYEWNVTAGLGSGSYFQDDITAGQWIYVTDIIDMKDTSPEYPTGYISIYKNGVLRKTTPLNQYNVVPGTTPTPFVVGTLTEDSFFEGAVGKVAVYDYALTQAQITTHYNAMSAASAGGQAAQPTPAQPQSPVQAQPPKPAPPQATSLPTGLPSPIPLPSAPSKTTNTPGTLPSPIPLPLSTPAKKK